MAVKAGEKIITGICQLEAHRDIFHSSSYHGSKLTHFPGRAQSMFRDIPALGLLMAVIMFPLVPSTRAQQQGTNAEAEQQAAGPVKELLDQSDAALTDNPEDALRLALQAQDLAEKRQDLQSVANALLSVGNALLRLNRYQEARQSFQRSLEIARRGGYEMEKARGLVNLGRIYKLEGDLTRALEFFSESLPILQHAGRRQDVKIVLLNIADVHSNNADYPKALEYLSRVLLESRDQRDSLVDAKALRMMGNIRMEQGEYAQALEHFRNCLEISRAIGDVAEEGTVLGWIGDVYMKLEDYTNAESNYKQALGISRKLADHRSEGWARIGLGVLADRRQLYPEALGQLQKAITVFTDLNQKRGIADALLATGDVQLHMGESAKARTNYLRSLKMHREIGSKDEEARALIGLGQSYLAEGKAGPAYEPLVQGLALTREVGQAEYEQVALENLAHLHAARGEYQLAYSYYRESVALADSVIGLKKQQQLYELSARFEARDFEQRIALLEKDRALQQADIARAEFERNTMVAGAVVLFLLAAALFNRYRFKQRSTMQLEKAYGDLQRTQEQLIHAEKMATLGELTAGIAHEIKNPLNFINNFAGMNGELLQELLETLPPDNAEARELMDLIETNSRKILEHGERADGIVRTMLEHSREQKGALEDQSVNALIEEALEVISHSRKIGELSVEVRHEMDSAVGLVPMIGTEMLRVLLNLIGNAVYAARARAAAESDGYEPRVFVRSALREREICISVTDNGTGMTEEVRKKIFDPFYTTKPTGEGTGLGLSLSWDIVVKGHHGRLEVESTVGEGSEFRVYLPVAAG